MNEELYIALFQKKLEGKISPEEQEKLDAWLTESPENRIIGESIEQAWKLSGDYSQNVDLDLDEEFAMLDKRLDEQEVPQQQIVKLKTGFKWWPMAAAIAALVAIGFLVNNLFVDHVDWILVQTVSNQKEKVVLPDGTNIWINQNSVLTYPEKFKSKIRQVKLDGEAFFEVSENMEMPFSIETQSGATVQVLGTSFNVRDYKSEDLLEVQVKTGKVKFKPVKMLEDSLILEAMNKGIFDKKSNQLIKATNASPNNFAWYSSRLEFDEVSLQKCIRDIERLFGAIIEISNQEMEYCSFTSTFENKDLKIILETIAGVFGMEVEETGMNTFRLNGGNCQ